MLSGKPVFDSTVIWKNPFLVDLYFAHNKVYSIPG